MKKTTNSRSATKKTSVRKQGIAVLQTGSDARTAILIISLLGNMFVLCLWLVLQITTEYDQTLIDFFLNR